MEPFIEEALEAIKHDRTSGASQLAENGLKLLASIPDKMEGATDSSVKKRISETARALRTVRAPMAAIGGWAALFNSVASTSPDLNAKGAERLLQSLLDKRRQMIKGQIDGARPLLQTAKSVVSLSYSSTVVKILSGSAIDLAVTLAESRPLYEGRTMALALEKEGLGVTLITDAAITLAVAKSDAVIIGADTICSDGAVINKVGSFCAALAANESKKPFYVVADTFKINPGLIGLSAPSEDGSGAEVWPKRPDLAKNPSFETVPARFITRYITEKGVLTADEIGRETAIIASLYNETP